MNRLTRISLLVALFIEEDTLGGAKHDYFTYENYFLQFMTLIKDHQIKLIKS